MASEDTRSYITDLKKYQTDFEKVSSHVAEN